MQALHVVGCGPLGGLVAAAAASAGLRVRLLCLDRRRASLLRAEGLRLLRGGEALVRVEVDAYTGVREGVAVLAVPTYLLDSVERRLGEGVERVYVQPSPLVEKRLGGGGSGLIAFYGCAWLVEGVAGRIGYAVSSVRYSGLGGAAVEGLVEGLRFLGARVEERGDARSLLWDYVAAHASTQPVAAVLGTARLRGSRHAVALVESLAREVMIVMDEAGVKRLRSPVDAAHELLSVRGCLPKMMLDLQARRRTEVEEINGAVVKEALRLGVYAPYNDSVYLAVKALEELLEVGGERVEAPA